MRYFLCLFISIIILYNLIGVTFYKPLTLTKTTQMYSVPSSFDFYNQNQWDEIQNQLLTSTSAIQRFYWSGYGGQISIGDQFIESIKMAKKQGKTIVFNLNGNSFSMMSIVACYADNIKYNDYFLMFHADEWQSIVVVRAFSKLQDDLEVCVKGGILTQRDVNMIYNGYEVYTNGHKTWYKQDPRQ